MVKNRGKQANTKRTIENLRDFFRAGISSSQKAVEDPDVGRLAGAIETGILEKVMSVKVQAKKVKVFGAFDHVEVELEGVTEKGNMELFDYLLEEGYQWMLDRYDLETLEDYLKERKAKEEGESYGINTSNCN